MKFAYSEISGVFSWKEAVVPTIVIENQRLFRRLIKDVYLSIDGIQTPAVLSKDNKPIEFSKNAEIIDNFVNFNINRKTLLTKICLAIECNAVSENNYFETQKLLSEIENKINLWTFDFNCDITASKITVANILKSVGLAINDSYSGESGEAEKIIDYMELVREFDRDKFFMTVNMRSFFSDEVIESFMKTVILHEYKVLMIESSTHPLLKCENRLTIDYDLCEF